MKQKLFLILVFIFPIFSMAQNNSTLNTTDKIYDWVPIEQKPEFPGGETALLKYIGKNIKYPRKARWKGIQGTTYINFVIDKNGNVIDVVVAHGINSLLDAEAVRVIKSMPKWKPGKQEGKNVSVKYTVPIKFKLK